MLAGIFLALIYTLFAFMGAMAGFIVSWLVFTE
jgi:hypothetical protein